MSFSVSLVLSFILLYHVFIFMKRRDLLLMHKDEALQRFAALMDFRNLSPITLMNYLHHVPKFLDSFPDIDVFDLTVFDTQYYVIFLKTNFLRNPETSSSVLSILLRCRSRTTSNSQTVFEYPLFSNSLFRL